MSSHPAVKLLSSYLDAEVSPTELKLVEGHLGDCSECRSRVAGLRAVAEGVRRLEAVAPPASLAAQVERRVARASLGPGGFSLEDKLRGWVAQPVLAPVFAIILALGSILYLFAFGVARDEARGTRLVIASAPSEIDSGSPQEVAKDVDVVDTAMFKIETEDQVVAREPASAPEVRTSVASEQPAVRLPVAAAASGLSAATAKPAEESDSGKAGSPVEERSTAKRVAATGDAARSLEAPAMAITSAPALGDSVAVREVAGRRFVADGATWVEVGLEGVIADEVLDWRKGSEGRSSELEALRELGRVRVRLGDRVVEVVYPDATPPS